MQKSLIRKGIAFIVILLFIGVSIIPATSYIQLRSVRADQDNGLYQIIIEPYGLNDLRPKTINLTAEQYYNLKQYFVMFRERLNNTVEFDETMKLYAEALTELADLQIIPRDNHFNLVKNLLMQKTPNPRCTLAPSDDDYNILAFVSGSVTGLDNFLPPLYLLLITPASFLAIIIYVLFYGTHHISLLLYAMLIVISSIMKFTLNVNTYSPLSFFNNIDGPTKGWVHSLGLNGIKKWSGLLVTKPRFLSCPIIVGFTGYKILDKQNETHFFIGTCLLARIHVYYPY